MYICYLCQISSTGDWSVHWFTLAACIMIFYDKGICQNISRELCDAQGRTLPQQSIPLLLWSLKGIWHQSCGLPGWQLSNTVSWLISTFRTIHTLCQALTTSQTGLLCIKDPLSLIKDHFLILLFSQLLFNIPIIYYFTPYRLFCLATQKQRPDAHTLDICVSLNLVLRLHSACIQDDVGA